MIKVEDTAVLYILSVGEFHFYLCEYSWYFVLEILAQDYSSLEVPCVVLS